MIKKHVLHFLLVSIIAFVITENLSAQKIQFTKGVDKWTVLDTFDLHFDDQELEIELLEENLPSCIGIRVYK